MIPFRRVCTVQASAALIWGVLLLVLPGVVLGLLGVQADASELLVGRFGGGMMFALGATLWTVRDTTDEDQKTRVAVGNATCDAALALFLAEGFYSGSTSGFIGGMVVFFFALNTFSWLGTRIGAAPAKA